MNKKIFITILVLLTATNVYALRIQRPPVLRNPITEDQLSQLNKYMEQIFNLQNGRYELDIVTTDKSDANEGEIWIKNTGGVYSIRTMAGGTIRSVNLSP